MRALIIAGASCGILVACDWSQTPDPAAGPAGLTPLAEADNEPDAAPAPVDCTAIQAVLAAASEPVPFTSLRTGKLSLAGRELDDAFATASAPAGASCKIGLVDATAPATIHVVNCTLFTSGAADRDRNAELAKDAFDATRRQFGACLPADWTARDGSVPEVDATEAMIYESQADAQRAMTASSYTYPVQLRKEWAEGGPGQPSGWRVTLDFQKEASRQ